MLIEISPGRVVSSADTVREQGQALLTGDPPDDPGNTGFHTSHALRSWRDRVQRESRTLASSTAALADKLEESAHALKRADDEAADAAAALGRAVAA